jgi:hypothetical protein
MTDEPLSADEISKEPARIEAMNADELRAHIYTRLHWRCRERLDALDAEVAALKAERDELLKIVSNDEPWHLIIEERDALASQLKSLADLVVPGEFDS